MPIFESLRRNEQTNHLNNEYENQFMELPLKGIKVIDYTGVQSGPACSQLMAWLGADVLKVERMKTGDNTRIQLRDIPNADALYFTMVNSNKRSSRDQHQDARRQGDPGGVDPPLRCDGRKHGAGRARPPGLHLGTYP